MAKPSAAEIASQNERTSALGLAGRAVEHYAAAISAFKAIGEADAVWTADGQIGPFAPYSVMHLLAMSLEVILKAFLREKGLDVYEIKTSYGHDLVKLLDRAEREGLPALTGADDRVLLSHLNEQFLRREFEFTVTGVRTDAAFGRWRDLASEVFSRVLRGIPHSSNFLRGKVGGFLDDDLESRKLKP